MIYVHFRLTDANINLRHRGRKPNGDPRKLVGREKCSRLYWSGHDSRDRKQRSIQNTKNTHLDVRSGIRAKLIRKRFSIFPIMRSEILRFPHHPPSFSFRRVYTDTVKRREIPREAQYSLYQILPNKCVPMFLSRNDRL